MDDRDARDEVLERTYVRGNYVDEVFKALDEAGFRLIDTRTHVAIAREPSEETVERVARALHRHGGFDWDRTTDFFRGEYRRTARAAIAALVQGGGDEDV